MLRSEEKRNNLQAQVDSFIRRRRQVAELRSMLLGSTVRLLTVVGPPGVGKTRLSLQLAQLLLEEFPDGVHFVPLANIHDPGLVIPAIARVVGVRESPGWPVAERLIEQLGAGRRLLVLDNWGQVLAAAPSVSNLLAVCPGLKVLATSRESLRIAGEQEYPLWPLELPGPSQARDVAALARVPAVALFEARTMPAEVGDPSLDSLEALASLVGKSLLRQEPGANAEPRFRMLALIREYALERLEAAAELPATAQRHAAVFLELAERCELEIQGPGHEQAVRRLEAEHDNLRTAMRWLRDQEDGGEHLARLAGALRFFWSVRGHLSEGQTWLEAALARSGVSDLARAKALLGLGWLAWRQAAWLGPPRSGSRAWRRVAGAGIHGELPERCTPLDSRPPTAGMGEVRRRQPG